MKHYIIVANGQFLVREIIEEAIQDKIIVALDGAADRLARLGILPHIIVGDFDSIDKEAWGITGQDDPYKGKHSAHIIPWQDQNLTDLTKAIRYCDTQDAASITLVCATGNRLDHHEGSVRTLRAEYKKERPIWLHTEQQTLCFAKDETVHLEGEIGDKCGIVAAPAGSFSSQGLEYDVDDFILEFGFTESTCNALREPQAVVHVRGEALLIMPPMLLTQRQFMQQTEVERLQQQLRDALATSLNQTSKEEKTMKPTETKKKAEPNGAITAQNTSFNFFRWIGNFVESMDTTKNLRELDDLMNGPKKK